jgi:hypothetical protein
MDVLLGWGFAAVIIVGVAFLISVNDKALRRRRAFLELELLGSRIVPATLTYTGGGVTTKCQ